MKPVKVTIARIRMAVGTMACESVREAEAIVLKIIDMQIVTRKVTKRKKKKAPGSLRRLVMKYNVRLKKMALRILYGKSQSIDATASADGWYSA